MDTLGSMETVTTSRTAEPGQSAHSETRSVKVETRDKFDFFQDQTSAREASQSARHVEIPSQLSLNDHSAALSVQKTILPLDTSVSTTSAATASRKGNRVTKARRVISEGGAQTATTVSIPRKRKSTQAVEPSTDTVDGSQAVQEGKQKQKQKASKRRKGAVEETVESTEACSSSTRLGGTTEAQVAKPKKGGRKSQKDESRIAGGSGSNEVPTADGPSLPKEATRRNEMANTTLLSGENADQEAKPKLGIRTRRNNQLLARGEPRWSLAQSHPFVDSETGRSSTPMTDDQAVKTPLIWCGSKEELVAALPELAKPVNGVTWSLSPTPTIFVEDRAKGIIFSGMDAGRTSFEFKMTRDFICLSADLVTPSSQYIDKLAMRIRGGAPEPPLHRRDNQGPSTWDRPEPCAWARTPASSTSTGRQDAYSTARSLSTSHPPVIKAENGGFYRRRPRKHDIYTPETSSGYQDGGRAQRSSSNAFRPPVHGRGGGGRPYNRVRSERGPSYPRRSPGYVQRGPAPGRYSDFAPSPIHPPSNNRNVRHSYGPPSPPPQESKRDHMFWPSVSQPVPPPGFPANPGERSGGGHGAHPPHAPRSMRSTSDFRVPMAVPSTTFASPAHSAPTLNHYNGHSYPLPGPRQTSRHRASAEAVVGPTIADGQARRPSPRPAISAPSGNPDRGLDGPVPPWRKACFWRDNQANAPVSNVPLRSSMSEPRPQPSMSRRDHPLQHAIKIERPSADDQLRTERTRPTHHRHMERHALALHPPHSPPAPQVPPEHALPPHDAQSPLAVWNKIWSALPETQRSVTVDQPGYGRPLPLPSNAPMAFHVAVRPPDAIMMDGSRTLDEAPPSMEVDVPSTSSMAHSRSRPAFPQSQEHTAPQSRASSVDGDAESTLDQRIPCKLPPEVAAICDAYIAGTPVVAIAARAFLAQRWRIAVPEECGCAYLGFFRVTGVQERRVVPDVDVRKTLEPGHVAGRVEWRFRCRWVPSGEEVGGPEAGSSDADSSPSSSSASASSDGQSVRPWWSPTPSSPSTTNTDDHAYTTPRYLARRKAHPNYELLLEVPLHEAFHSPLPDFVRASPGDGDGDGDGDIPSGWWCKTCGRCEARRRRKAKGKGKEKAPPPPPLLPPPDAWVEKKDGEEEEEERDGEEGYAVGLDRLRDPQQTWPLSHPCNTYPADVVEGTVAEWDDGMQAFSYAWQRKTGVEGEGQGLGRVTHVFTGNAEGLQGQADVLLRDVQIQVPLKRAMGGSSPYFSYTLGRSKGAVSWDDAPECMMFAKDVMCARAGVYGEREDVPLDSMSVLAWVVAGTRKGSAALKATTHPVVLMLLGCEAAITFTPKAGFPEPEPEVAVLPAPAGEGMVKMEVDDDGDLEMRDEPLPLPGGDAAADGGEEEGSGRGGRGRGTEPEKKQKNAIVVTMVHGDVVVLSGDAFEYSIKRFGTSILLIGSTVDGT
ncbi:hypothetical protein LshimejAT787_1000190 [Lyophyllum shimeji]|uniref:Uncharacterized protein n=1 Tax=Lyophyllum shimeji TaxID=47721 RepID=A0A9P3PTS1_LYOSH|nr:hypothetical protein LshimejAT787_1000190 [Lyophyllum shimeji]